MTRLTIVAAFGILTAISSFPARAGYEPAEHEHEHDTEVFSAGEPGDPKKPSRVIQVTMQESDGKMLFVPNHVEVRKASGQNSCSTITESLTTNSCLQQPKKTRSTRK